jgi:hypothetical protein
MPSSLVIEYRYVDGDWRWCITRNGEIISHSHSFVLISNLHRELSANPLPLRPVGIEAPGTVRGDSLRLGHLAKVLAAKAEKVLRGEAVK